ncbi:MAG: hypothetical protein ACXV5H_09685 [Halobacteriota archaeon]
MLTIITTSRRQGQYCEVLSGGSLSAKLRADGQKSHKRPSSRGELAHDNETHRFEEHGKCGGCAATVHVLIWGDLFNMRWRVSKMNDSWATVLNVPAAWQLSAKMRANSIAIRPLSIAPVRVTAQVIKQKSADGIVLKAIGEMTFGKARTSVKKQPALSQSTRVGGKER